MLFQVLPQSFVQLLTIISLPPFIATSSLATSPPRDRKVQFTVDEPSNANVHVNSSSSSSYRHLHAVRHSFGKFLPYKSASASVTNSKANNRLESFSLNCPHVVDASSPEVHIEVIWTLNDTVWLKVEDGEKKVLNKLSTFNKRRVGGKTVLRVLLNNGRYAFDYDELTGDFAMEVTPVILAEDVGSWQCHVSVYQRGGSTHTLTSRRRIKLLQTKAPAAPSTTTSTKAKAAKTSSRLDAKSGEQEARPSYQRVSSVAFYDTSNEPTKRRYRGGSHQQSSSKFASRTNGHLIFITREDDNQSGNVMFSRTDTDTSKEQPMQRSATDSSEMHAHIDYELDMSPDVDYGDPFSRSRPRSAQLNGSPTTLLAAYPLLSLLTLFTILIF